MPATQIYGAHLDQEELSDGIKKDLQQLGEWLSTPAAATKFVKRTDRLQTYAVNTSQDEKVKPLLEKLGFANAYPPAGCLIYRITGSSFLQNSTGPASIVPIKILGGKPTAGAKLLKLGHITYTTSDVLIEPELDIIVFFPLRKADS